MAKWSLFCFYFAKNINYFGNGWFTYNVCVHGYMYVLVYIVTIYTKIRVCAFLNAMERKMRKKRHLATVGNKWH